MATDGKYSEKAVRWKETKLSTGGDFTANGRGNTKTTRKRFSERDQPTWQNCKYPRPFHSRTDESSTSSQSGFVESPQYTASADTSDALQNMPYPGGSMSPKPASMISSPRFGSARSSGSGSSGQQKTVGLVDLVNGSLDQKDRGREILRKKAKEILVRSAPSRFRSFQPCECGGEIAYRPKPPSNKTTRSQLRSFRLSSASSSHRSSDISIGLRQLSRVLRSTTSDTIPVLTQRRQSESVLLSLTRATAYNIDKTRRQSEPIISIGSNELKVVSAKTLAPGEGYWQPKRRSSLSAPATRGSESNAGGSKTKHFVKFRQLPTSSSTIYADREWRPTNLQKFSTKPPWAPKQQTTRYFPKFPNLQDIHCRNPYLVPGSVLYKKDIIYD